MALNINDRSARHEALVELLRSREFSNQKTVAQALERLGFEVTQASVSRDFHELGISKVAGSYVPRDERRERGEFGQLVVGAEPASPFLFVIRTSPGAASIVAEKVDRMSLPGVVGTVAGENTIFVATKNRTAQGRLRTLFVDNKASN